MSRDFPWNTTIVFYDPQYPGAFSAETLSTLLPDALHIVSANDLATHLRAGYTLLVSFHGPYFPKDAWGALLQFLEQGGKSCCLWRRSLCSSGSC